jgi:hypothetical protein
MNSARLSELLMGNNRIDVAFTKDMYGSKSKNRIWRLHC